MTAAIAIPTWFASHHILPFFFRTDSNPLTQELISEIHGLRESLHPIPDTLRQIKSLIADRLDASICRAAVNTDDQWVSSAAPIELSVKSLRFLESIRWATTYSLERSW